MQRRQGVDFSADFSMIDCSPTFITLLAIGISSIVLLYWYSVRNHDYWKKRGILSANTVPFLGSLFENLREPHHDLEERRYKQLGRIYGHFEASRPVLSIADPVLLRDILVKDFAFFHDRRALNTGDKIMDSLIINVQGEDWKRIRSIITPVFSSAKIKRMMNIFKECSRTLIQNIRADIESGKRMDAKRLYGAFTMDVIASSAFSTKIDSHNDPDNEFILMAKQVFIRTINWRFLFFFLAPRLMRALGISIFPKGTMDFFTNVTLQIMEERKKTGKTRNDFLQLLMDTANEVSQEQNWETHSKEKDDIAANYGEEHPTVKTDTSKNISMEELVAQCVIFFLGGYDTTASTLSFCTYNLAIHPDIQDKVRKEVDRAIKENTGELTYEAIQSVKYLDNIISETLRMYPPAIRLERVASADYDLRDTGISIPKGMIISIPIYPIHKDPEFYPEPEKFDPDRFTPEKRGNRDQYTYIPFGVGPRNCLGMRFALMEIKMCLAHVIANFNIKRCPETLVPLEFHIAQGFMQPKDIFVQMELREISQIK